MAIIEEKEFRGQPILSIKEKEDQKYPVAFGLKKARIILAHIVQIKCFVEKYDKKAEEEKANKEE